MEDVGNNRSIKRFIVTFFSDDDILEGDLLVLLSESSLVKRFNLAGVSVKRM